MTKAQKYLEEHDLWDYFVNINGDVPVTYDTIQNMINDYCNEELGELYEPRKDYAVAVEQHFDMAYNLGRAQQLATEEAN